MDISIIREEEGRKNTYNCLIQSVTNVFLKLSKSLRILDPNREGVCVFRSKKGYTLPIHPGRKVFRPIMCSTPCSVEIPILRFLLGYC